MEGKAFGRTNFPWCIRFRVGPSKAYLSRRTRVPQRDLSKSAFMFSAFVCERDFYEGEIGKIAYNAPNYNLFRDTDAALEALRSHPLAEKIDAV